jgi:hypothetical protein
MFAVKAEVLRALLSDPKWNVKLEKAKTMREVERVLRLFAVEKGWKVKKVD